MMAAAAPQCGERSPPRVVLSLKEFVSGPVGLKCEGAAGRGCGLDEGMGEAGPAVRQMDLIEANHEDYILEHVHLDAVVTVGGQMGSGGVTSGKEGADGIRSAPVAIPPKRTALRPGVDVLSPEAWRDGVLRGSDSVCSSPGDRFDDRNLRAADLATRHTPPGTPPRDSKDVTLSLNYHITVPLDRPVELGSLAASHRFLVELQCTKEYPLEMEHVYVPRAYLHPTNVATLPPQSHFPLQPRPVTRHVHVLGRALIYVVQTQHPNTPWAST